MPKKYMNYDRTQELIINIRKALNPKPKIVTWADGTDEEICACIEALDNGVLTTEDLGWDVGDERVVHLNAVEAGTYNNAHPAQDAIFVIIDTNGYKGVGNYIVGLKYTLSEKEKIGVNASGDENSWSTGTGQKACAAIFDGMFPTYLKQIAKTMSVTSYNNAYNDYYRTADCKLAINAAKEILGNDTNINAYERSSSDIPDQFEYYKTAANRIKIGGGYYGTRSRPNSNPSYGFLPIDGSGNAGIYNISFYDQYISPFMVI